MYFPFFVLHDWGKRSAEARSLHCAVLPKNNSRRILEKLRIFIYNIFCIIVSVRKERRMKGYLSIRETSYKCFPHFRMVSRHFEP